jgi:tRNA nucleotidyltransferase (CCA-adding enzyme)
MPVIRDVMNNSVITIRSTDTLTEAVRVLCRHHLSGAPVVSADGEILGFMSESGLMDVLFDASARSAPVSDYMSRELYMVHPEDSIADAATIFALYGVRRLPVVENGNLLGVITRRDLLEHTLSGARPFNDPLAELIPAIHQFA